MRTTLQTQVLFFFSLLFAHLLSAQESSTTCYRFARPESPESAPAGILRTELWCYQKLSSPRGALYVYNADGSDVRSELAFVVEPDGMMTHGSLLAGRKTIHKINGKQFNPFPVPTEEPLAVSASFHGEIEELSESAGNVLQELLTQPAEYTELAVREGEFDLLAAADIKPWRGFWWPYKSQRLSKGSNSPLAKYDRFVKAKTGTNPGAQKWENTYHKFKGAWWHGHCNGWAASSVLRAEPAFSVKDPVSGTVFSISDQKGILAETDYCASIAFFGKRYRGKAGDDLKDIYPKDFHYVLTYYIGTLRKPLAIDYYQNTTVDNHVVSGYKMAITKTGPDIFKVEAQLQVHKYDSSPKHKPGIAPIYTRTYRYTLQEDGDGQIIGGKWLTTNPDFLWAPLSPQDCNSNNPKISHAYTEEVLALPAL